METEKEFFYIIMYIKYFLAWYFLEFTWIFTCENKASFWQKICKFMFYLFNERQFANDMTWESADESRGSNKDRPGRRLTFEKTGLVEKI